LLQIEWTYTTLIIHVNLAVVAGSRS